MADLFSILYVYAFKTLRPSLARAASWHAQPKQARQGLNPALDLIDWRRGAVLADRRGDGREIPE